MSKTSSESTQAFHADKTTMLIKLAGPQLLYTVQLPQYLLSPVLGSQASLSIRMVRQVVLASALVLLCAGLALAKPKVQVRKIKIENLQLLYFCITVLLCSRRIPPLREVRTCRS
jgi:hypothetical protein